MCKLFKRKQKENIDVNRIDNIQRAFVKIQKCIRSCKTLEQLHICNNMIKNFNILYADINITIDFTNELYREISNAIIEIKSMLLNCVLYDPYTIYYIKEERFVRKYNI